MWHLFFILNALYNVVFNFFNLGQSRIFSSGNGLTFYTFLFHHSTLSQSKLLFLCFFSAGLLKTLGKGEIARNEQFVLFPQCFLPLSVWKSLKFVVCERVNYTPDYKILHQSKFKVFVDDKIDDQYPGKMGLNESLI